VFFAGVVFLLINPSDHPADCPPLESPQPHPQTANYANYANYAKKDPVRPNSLAAKPRTSASL